MIASSRHAVRGAVAVVMCSAAPVIAGAQGLSSQGFGYPVGGVSVRSLGTGSSFSEFDALSTHNPASIGGIQRLTVTAQAEPEYRTLRLGNVRERNTFQRVPLVLAMLPGPRNVTFAISASSLLDRTFDSERQGTAVLADETVTTRDTYNVRGSMSTLRAAAGYRINDRISVGVAGHLVVGANDVAISRNFTDSVRFGSVVDTSRVEFTGTAISLGTDVRVSRAVAVSASYRVGNTLDAREFDRVETSAKVPSRLGASVRYEGIPGSIFALGVEQVQWSAMRGLGTVDTDARDAVNFSIGAEVSGPELREWPVQLRAGYTRMQLPFAVGGAAATENRLSTGVGIPLAQEWASLDLSLQRATRSHSPSRARETSWFVGIGLQIRPQ